jgi:hypothetical protein
VDGAGEQGSSTGFRDCPVQPLRHPSGNSWPPILARKSQPRRCWSFIALEVGPSTPLHPPGGVRSGCLAAILGTCLASPISALSRSREGRSAVLARQDFFSSSKVGVCSPRSAQNAVARRPRSTAAHPALPSETDGLQRAHGRAEGLSGPRWVQRLLSRDTRDTARAVGSHWRPGCFEVHRSATFSRRGNGVPTG